jgi:hypothetical protein
VGRVGKDNVVEEARQGVAKLHGIPGGNSRKNRVFVEAAIGLLDNGWCGGGGHVEGCSPRD